MTPGEFLIDGPEIELNPGRPESTLEVSHTGERPIRVGSHFHFAETNAALVFDRQAALGLRLNLPSGTTLRFEPGEDRTVRLVPFAGARRAWGFRGLVNGPLDGERD